MKLPLYFIYLGYSVILALIMIVLVPRRDVHKLALLGIIYGAVIDIFWIIFIGLVGGGGYLNYGPLGFMSLPFIPPIAWTIYFILFLYFSPPKMPWNYLFSVIAAVYSVIFSNVLSNLGIFHWTFSKVFFPLGIYLVWHIFVTWSYTKYGIAIVQKAMESGKHNRNRLFLGIKSNKESTNLEKKRWKKLIKIK